ncbi:hypothetical protein C8R43DRAFT_1133507 [Mycena crocata]|nr:hypothetical protein C8R43DRAFT_1133507 [Mycena crocata]
MLFKNFVLVAFAFALADAAAVGLRATTVTAGVVTAPTNGQATTTIGTAFTSTVSASTSTAVVSGTPTVYVYAFPTACDASSATISVVTATRV